MSNKKRVDFRKNRAKPPRPKAWTRGFQEHGFEDEATVHGERVRTKGDLSRKRTVAVDRASGARTIDLENCLPGRVLRVHGLDCVVATDEGREWRCKVRRHPQDDVDGRAQRRRHRGPRLDQAIVRRGRIHRKGRAAAWAPDAGVAAAGNMSLSPMSIR